MLILIVDIIDIVNMLEVDLNLIPQEPHSQVVVPNFQFLIPDCPFSDAMCRRRSKIIACSAFQGGKRPSPMQLQFSKK